MIHGDVLGERRRLSSARTALVEVANGRRFSYAELDDRARRTARVWRETLGLQAGDRICMLSGNRVEVVEAFFAAAKSGVILVPLGTRLTAAELAHIVADCGARALVFDHEHRERAAALRQLVDLEYWVGLDAGDGDCALADLSAAVSAAPLEWPHPEPEHTHCLLYTSGTTGRPKGVVIPQRMVGFNAIGTVLNWQLGEEDVSPIFTPLYHAGGLGAFLTPILAAGGTIVLHAGFDATEVWRAIEEERCTVVLGVPTIWKLLADDPGFTTSDLSHVRWFISGGAPLPRHLIELYRERGVVLRQGYGLTEVGVNCFSMSSEEAWTKSGSIGRPMMFTEARVVDEANRPLPADEVGELVFRGPHLSAGYWNNTEATAASRDPEGWFHTGDMARVDEDGFFSIAGRGKDMFISGGVNVYPAEIENELLQHPGLADAAVVGVEHATWGEVGVAFVVAATAPPPSAEDLEAFLKDRIAKFKIPKHFVFIDALPRTAYGKVVKGELKEQYQASAAAEAAPKEKA